ncbi:Gfo/Idh/MocA family oxidoreductase [Rhodococcus sp. BP-316]|uniref:Gfo/Idh/MocA family protein n=1 Tax=Rhodococcus sp. BP-316 TaxID=2739445 RepID=UPI001C9AC0A1|nr:Gfo/Idh/MocA family oxidoreductase [Rhodococcus sp. BP-316]MBY6680939.1 Gfo/Idh/MocA family oxidoreductase [Rhodococcus sp. BP-316]
MTQSASLPLSRVPDPRDAPVLRWAVLGPGWIAHRFVESLHRHTTQTVVAVGSRSPERARAFADEHGVDRAHGTYEAVFADDDVDIVYIATPHTEHLANALDAIAAGKHVLVEKPLAVDAVGAARIAEAARSAGVFAGEAMWTRFLPKFDVIEQVLRSGVLGPIHTVLADHGEFFTTDHRIYDPALAGGPLLDLGTYVASFAYSVLGAPETVDARSRPANDEIDGQISALLTGESGHAVLNTTILTNTPTTAVVCGRDGTLTIAGPFFMPGPFTVALRDGITLAYDETPGLQVDGLHLAAVEAARRISVGEVESAVHPLADAVATLEIIDRIRDRIS